MNGMSYDAQGHFSHHENQGNGGYDDYEDHHDGDGYDDYYYGHDQGEENDYYHHDGGDGYDSSYDHNYQPYQGNEQDFGSQHPEQGYGDYQGQEPFDQNDMYPNDGSYAGDGADEEYWDGQHQQDHYQQDPNAQDPNAQDPNAQDPNAQDPNAQNLNAQDPNQQPDHHGLDQHTDHNDHANPDEISQPGGPTLNVKLENTFQQAGTTYAYVTGQAIDHNNSLFILSADGKTPYFVPASSAAGAKLQQDVAITVQQGESKIITIPHVAGGRIYFSMQHELDFAINPGPALVEPAANAQRDPNYMIDWGFVEYTFNSDQLYANISYVDFVGRIPLGLALDTASGQRQTVSGMAADGFEHVCQEINEQAQKDGQPWDHLIINDEHGQPLRILSPNLASKSGFDLGQYYDHYIEQAWQHLSDPNNKITIDTQAAAGKMSGYVQGDQLELESEDGAHKASFTKPETKDVLMCDSGPFQTGQGTDKDALIPRLAAAFNRSTLMLTQEFPEAEDLHYKDDITNHYSRIMHEVNTDGKGYAFPYDDVQPTGGADQSGEVHAADAMLFTVIIGGGDAGEQQHE
ncbi:hypothetical protein LTR47_000128 [Exophiala xenobiotica]|nr:hypothetical protein LTR47_000128 [Exophiala xenobiotica]KAK5252636.1 hypothetical protein LTS06_002813 [Exophiala xenobiotica]KAK5262265.1 hypothetical protein LTR40_000605 [Exophiala xenobiotica]KAK5349889.1 hypothetical protein LTR61_006595 [Exophiala xenobiotica]KAK5387192.1 hypothetical protein LTR11_000857 [Exophiala xenobiotica]